MRKRLTHSLLYQRSRGLSLLYVLIWIALAATVYYLADLIQRPNTFQNTNVNGEAVLKRSPDGHYRTQARINGELVDVLVDTGATGVAISQAVADRLNLKSINAIRSQTANGDTVGYLVRLDTVQVGGIITQDVGATIVPNLYGDALLGMSFLGRMDVRLYKGTMTIRPAN